MTRFPLKMAQAIFRTTGMLFCFVYVAVISSGIFRLLKKKQAPKRTFTRLDIDCMPLPELGKKLQQSFR